MQDNNQDFDLQLRSMLEDAGVRPPRGTWKIISRRLDAATDTSARMFRALRWAGTAIAFAAVALGVFLIIPESSETPREISRGALTAENNLVLTPGIKDAASLKALPEHRPAGSEATSTSEATARKDETEYGTQHEESYGRQTPANGNSRGAATAREDNHISSGTDTADPFAILALQEEQGNRRRSGTTLLYAKGAIGGNDPDFVRRSAGVAMAPGASSSGITELSESTYGIPLTLGLGIRIYLLPRLSVGTGVDYSLLTRTFTGTYTGPGNSGETQVTEAGNVQHTMQYIGVPLDIYYDIMSSDKIKFYVYGGGEAEYCVSNKYTVFSSPKITCSEPVRKFQYSIGGGVGVEFRLAENLGLYLDPGVKYYFPGGQPKSIRTDKPFMFNFDAGLRFSL